MNPIGKSIRTELLLISGTGTVLLLAAALFGFWLSWGNLHSLEQEMEARDAEERMVLGMQLDFKKQVQEWKDVLLRGSNPDLLKKYWENFEQDETRIRETGQSLLRGLKGEPQAREILAKFLESHEKMGKSYRSALEAFKAARFDSAAGDAQIRGMDREPTELLSRVAGMMTEYNARTARETVTRGQRGILISLGLMGAAVLAAFLIFLSLLQKTIVKPASELVSELERLAKGDFSQPISHGWQDELGKIAASAETVRSHLGAIVAEVHRTAGELSGASSALAASADRLSSGSSQQAEAAASAASAVDEVTASIATVADNATRVRMLSATNLARTQSGNSSLSELVGEISLVESAVTEIGESVTRFMKSTESITHMTREVKEIAEQTNLLALNAAIEAARAGEQGRGFAVVADEVRKLAEKSASAASEIDKVTRSLNQQSETVEQSIRKGTQSLEVSNEVMEHVAISLAEANQAVMEADRGVEEITNSVQQQQIASSAIAGHVSSIAQMAEENGHAIAGEASEAKHVEDLAKSLQGMMSRFRT